MVDIFEIAKFLPTTFEREEIAMYVAHHFDQFQKSLDGELQTGAFLHAHILFMTFIYFQLLRISRYKEKEFRYSWIGLANSEKDFFEDALNPFSFSRVQERTVFRFFRLIDLDDAFLGEIRACVDERNKVAHASGIQMKDFELKIERYVQNMGRVVEKSKDFIYGLYLQFKKDNPELYADNYELTDEDITLYLRTPFLFSDHELKKLSEWVEEDKFTKKIIETLE